jgi:hypothetical protein
MARAGYHPDYLFALRQLLAHQPGERSRPAVSLSDPLTWEAEESQIEGQYANAIAEYHKYWPKAAQSPGGLPPTVVVFGVISASEDEAAHSPIVSVPVWCRNSATPIKLEVKLHRVEHANNTVVDHAMSLTTMAPCSDQSANMQVKFRIPAEMSTSEGRELSAAVTAYANNSHFLGASREFNVNIRPCLWRLDLAQSSPDGVPVLRHNRRRLGR